MDTFKILASDLDGTLFNSRSEVSLENLAAIAALKGRGVQFVPCTGRTLSEVPDILKENGDIRYIIHSNGAVIFDKKTDTRVLYGISGATASRLFTTLGRFRAHLAVRYEGNCYIDAAQDVHEVAAYYNLHPWHVAALSGPGHAIPKDNFGAWLRTLDGVEVVAAFFHSEEERQECRRALLETGELQVAEVAAYNLEIFSRDAGKGNALLHLADMLAIPHAQTAAVGDSGNDISMISAAGCGFAVQNATPALMAVADRTVCSNDDHAIRDILLHHLA